MPVCEGRTDGPGMTLPCPDTRNDNSVELCQGDLMLCKSCCAHRFPDVSSDVNSTNSTKEVRNEVLYFIQNKCHALTVDNIASICADFFTCAELESARALMTKCSAKRLTKHKGGTDREKRERTAVDLVKFCLDPVIQLPIFYSTNMARIPSVGVEHIDISALVQEVASLRAEVRSFAAARAEISDIRAAISAIQTPSQSMGVPITDVINNPPAAQSFAVSQKVGNSAIKTYASVANTVITSGVAAKKQAEKKTPSRPPIVGRSTNSSSLKSVKNKRSIDIFVSRLSPDTVVDDVTSCVADVLDGKFNEHITCVQLQAKSETYRSFHVSVLVDVQHTKTLIELLNSADSWPEGVLVRRFFKLKKNV